MMSSKSEYQTPLTTQDLLEIRLIELATYLDGEIGDDQYPLWVRSNGAFLAKKIAPKIWLKRASADPNAFMKGLITGFCLWLSDQPIDSLLRDANHTKTGRVIRTSGIPDLARIRLCDALRVAPKIPDHVKKKTKQTVIAAFQAGEHRSPFFHGFAIGLDFTESFDEIEHTRHRVGPSGKLPLRIYLWLRWPEFEAMSNISRAYERCKAAFDSIGESEIVGDQDSFRRFCNRLGLSYKET